MQLKAGLKLRKVGDTYMLVDVSKEHPEITYIHTLNETAAIVWNALGEGVPALPEIATRLCEEYDVDHATALKDISALIELWREQGLL